MPNITVIENNLAKHKLSMMRDKRTRPNRFRRLVRQASWILCTEMAKDLDLEDRPIVTANNHSMLGEFRDQGGLVIMPILRAGLVMAESFSDMLPMARTAHVGIFRDAENPNRRHCYMLSLPDMQRPQRFFLLDVTVSRGATMALAYQYLRDAGVAAEHIRCGCILAAKPGVEFLQDEHPDISLFTLGLDDEVDDNGYIVPGMGNPSVRLFRTDEADETDEESVSE